MEKPLVRERSIALVFRRIGAYGIDAIIIFTLFVFTQSVLLTPLRERFFPGWSHPGWHLELYTWLTISFPAWIYMAGFESSSWQASLGKRLLGLRVIGAGGERIEFWRAMLRAAVKFLPWEFTHMIVNLPDSMWINPQTGALAFDNPVDPNRVKLFIAVYGLLAIYLGITFLSLNNRGPDDLVANTLVVERKGRL